MRKITLFLLLLISAAAGAQKISRSNLKALQNIEDTLAPFAKTMVFDSMPFQRFYADSAFIRNLVRALKIPNSFYYPFQAVNTVSILYPPDSSFRIFSWEIQRDESYYRQYGAVQMHTEDGSLKLYPLHDASEYTASPTDSVRTISNWIGAIYYGIVMKEYAGKKYYTLLGFDDNDFTTTRKWLEVMTFDENGNPQFGGKYFDYEDDSIKTPQPVSRFLLEFKKDANARMVYDPDMDMILFDHLISETDELQKKFTLIPDGDYEGFKWQNGKWVHVVKVFTLKLPEGKEPHPALLYDDNGMPDESKLEEQSNKNQKKPPTPKIQGSPDMIEDIRNY